MRGQFLSALLSLLLAAAAGAAIPDWFSPDAHEELASIAFGEPGHPARLADAAPWSDGARQGCRALDPPLVVTTHVPKCAGQSLRALIRAVQQESRSFTTIHSQKFFGKQPSGPKLRLARPSDVFDYWSALARAGPRFHYENHVRFVDGTHAAFVALVRDPVSHAVSHYYYKRRGPAKSERKKAYIERFGNRSFDECVALPREEWWPRCGIQPHSNIVTWLCGYHEDCAEPESEAALARAKRNIEEHYVAVGTVERMGEFVGALQARLPGYFSGLARFYADASLAHTNRTPHGQPSAASRARMRAARANDYRLFYWVNERMDAYAADCAAAVQ